MNRSALASCCISLLACTALGPGVHAREDPQLMGVDAHIQRSFDHFVAGQYRQCIEEAGAALRLDAGSAIAYNNICSARVKLGEYDKAVSACEKALQLVPDYERARNNLEWAYEKKVNDAPTPDAYVSLAVVRYWQGKLDLSLEASNKALELDPQSALAYNNICAAHAKKGEWGPAVTACERALAIEPGFERARNNLAWAESGKAGE